jgi:hypothetical protein
LDFGFWIFDFGFWILDFGFWILDFGFWIFDFGFWILVFGFSILDFGFWILKLSAEFGAFRASLPERHSRCIVFFVCVRVCGAGARRRL